MSWRHMSSIHEKLHDKLVSSSHQKQQNEASIEIFGDERFMTFFEIFERMLYEILYSR